jgi:hypothetical protein
MSQTSDHMSEIRRKISIDKYRAGDRAPGHLSLALNIERDGDDAVR